MIPQTFDEAFAIVQTLVSRFQQNQSFYLSTQYDEATARKDFIDKMWTALGWDVNHEEQTNPYEQEVKVERGVTISQSRRRADYAFLAPNFRDVRFYVEAKKPSVELENKDHYFQTIRYGWNSNTPVAVLTDFEQFHILDCRFKPDVNTSLYRVLKKYHFSDYTDRDKFAEIYYLFSREAVHSGSIEKYAEGLPKPTGKARQKALFPTGGYQEVDESFLQKLDEYREELARSFKLRNPHLESEDLTEITHRTLDRLVFIRFLEDKLIETEPLVENFGNKSTVWQDFIATSARLDKIYNGIIFKKHEILDSPNFKADEKVFDGICEELSHANSPYDFNSIPIHILGSIYERFLGKTIVATDKRATVEEKPEVRKAGGVYYTPEYIVRYIVENTVGKMIAGKKPEEIREMRFADISCGSGSFLLGVYDLLLRYHTAYFNANKTRRKEGVKAGCREGSNGALSLSLWQRREILLNNIYGVDIDAQAVEVAQLSLYLKMLEDETTASAKAVQLELREALLPSLSKNIICGNSLIDWDILDGKLFETREERKLNPMDFADKFPQIMKAGGFDAIVGNPPYIRIQTLQESNPLSVDYFKRHYLSASKGNYDIYVVFVEQALRLLNERGKLGYILPHKFFNAKYGEPLRGLVAKGKHLSQVVHFGDQQVFEGATTYTCLLFLNKSSVEECLIVKAADLNAWKEKVKAEERTIEAKEISADEWNFAVGKTAALLKKLNEMPVRLNDIAERIGQGIRTSANEIYVLDLIEANGSLITAYSQKLGRDVVLERESVLQFLQGREIKSFRILASNKIVILPYRINGSRAELISEKAFKRLFPHTFDYFSENKKFLKNREKGRFSGSDWFAYGRTQNIELMLMPKILVPDIADRAAFAFDEVGQYAFTSGYGITLKSNVPESAKYVLGLLNSRILDLYLKSVSTTLRGGFFRYFTQFVEQLPIRTINFSDKTDKARHDRMVQLVEQMIEAKKMLAKVSSDRDKAYYEGKSVAFDHQIDTLVYELYGLTDEEICIVEGE